MHINREAYIELKQYCDAQKVTLVAVSKTKPKAALEELYALGHRDFGENYVQELIEKEAALPKDIRWHFIGHLQSNKIKYIAPFVHLIHGVDSEKLLQEINKQGIKINKKIDCLLQAYIAQEETKFGLDETEIDKIIKNYLDNKYTHVNILGFMGMASFSDENDQIKKEFGNLAAMYNTYNNNHQFTTLSMGMSGDYKIALEQGSNLIRVGSLIFGVRNYHNG